MTCQLEISKGKYVSTYCQLESGHEGKCQIVGVRHGWPKSEEPRKVKNDVAKILASNPDAMDSSRDSRVPSITPSHDYSHPPAPGDASEGFIERRVRGYDRRKDWYRSNVIKGEGYDRRHADRRRVASLS